MTITSVAHAKLYLGVPVFQATTSHSILQARTIVRNEIERCCRFAGTDGRAARNAAGKIFVRKGNVSSADPRLINRAGDLFVRMIRVKTGNFVRCWTKLPTSLERRYYFNKLSEC